MGDGDTHQAANHSHGDRAVDVRELTSIAEMREIEAIQREVWGLPDIEVVPASQLKAAVHAGGHVAGAFDAESMIGFAYGLVAAPHGVGVEGLGLHSHMLAVREQGRQRGTGRALKWFQRSWCLERDMRWMTWTFDPLQARNAKLNFEHLGVVSREYLVDFYGVMSGPLGSDASDRLVALWLLDTERVSGRAAADLAAAQARAVSAGPTGEVGRSSGREPTRERDPARELWVLRAEDVHAAHSDAADGETAAEIAGTRIRLAITSGESPTGLRIAVPPDVTRLRQERPLGVASWRDAIRAAIIPAIEAGYEIVGFEDDAYRLARPSMRKPNIQ